MASKGCRLNGTEGSRTVRETRRPPGLWVFGDPLAARPGGACGQSRRGWVSQCGQRIGGHHGQAREPGGWRGAVRGSARRRGCGRRECRPAHPASVIWRDGHRQAAGRRRPGQPVDRAAARQAPDTGDDPVHQHRPRDTHHPAGNSGTFTARLPAGTYRVSFRTPRHLEVSSNGTGHQTWSSPRTVTITPRHTTRIIVTSIVP